MNSIKAAILRRLGLVTVDDFTWAFETGRAQGISSMRVFTKTALLEEGAKQSTYEKEWCFSSAARVVDETAEFCSQLSQPAPSLEAS